jgi:hypothetical protein
MRRRDFMTGQGIAAALPTISRAQQETPTIGFLSTRAPDEAEIHTNAFRRGVEEMGYVESRNVVISLGKGGLQPIAFIRCRSAQSLAFTGRDARRIQRQKPRRRQAFGSRSSLSSVRTPFARVHSQA